MTNQIDLDKGEQVDTKAGQARSGSKIQFDATINLGTIISLLTIIGGSIWGLSAADAHFRQLDDKITGVTGSVRDLSQQVERSVERIDKRIDTVMLTKK